MKKNFGDDATFQTGFYPDPNDKNDDRVDHSAMNCDEDAPSPLPCSEPISRKAKLLSRDCVPGDFVTWSDVQGWTFTGELKEWDNGTALIMWPMIQTPLIAVRG